MPIDLGASWLHGIDGNPIADIAKQLHLDFSLSIVTQLYFLNQSHKKISVEQIQYFREKKFNALLNKIHDQAHYLEHDIPLLKAIKDELPYFNLTMQDELLRWELHFLGLFTGSSVDQLSAQHWDEEKILPGGNFFISNGYHKIIDYLANGCQIKLNTIVTKINYNANDIIIHTDNETLTADKVIITIPLGVLQREADLFNPALPKDKTNAIQALGMGLLNKFILKFPTAFWPAEFHSIYLSDLPLKHVRHFVNYLHYNNVPMLMGACSGQLASEIEKLSDRDIVATIMDDLRQYFGTNIPDCESHLITRWGQDPYTYGSYSYIPVGASGDDYDELAKPINNQLFFAGEATSRDYLGTVHGAYFSGIREAERLLSS